MSRRRRKSIAWIALATMLFGAVSPALAAALYRDRSDILGRMLQIPAAVAHAAPQAAAVAGDDGCPHETASGGHHEPTPHSGHQGTAGRESDGSSEHAAHAAFCSFCLSASSVVTLLCAGPAPCVPSAGCEPVAGTGQRLAEVTPAHHRARGPPTVPC